MIRSNRFPLKLHPEARVEFIETYRYHHAQDARYSIRLRRRVRDAMWLIAHMPDTWPLYLWRTRRCVLSGTDYSIVFRRMAETIQIVAFAHAKRRPGYWRHRLGSPDPADG